MRRSERLGRRRPTARSRRLIRFVERQNTLPVVECGESEGETRLSKGSKPSQMFWFIQSDTSEGTPIVDQYCPVTVTTATASFVSMC